MKRCLFLSFILAIPTVGQASGSCVPEQTAVIESETKCVPQGISIGVQDEDASKAACLTNKEVQGRCGPDGSITRLHAYMEWFNKLKKFEDTCSAKGGTFMFQDANFVEPTDESFCMQATPELGSNMFEEALCNYRSLCPAVKVICEHSC